MYGQYVPFVSFCLTLMHDVQAFNTHTTDVYNSSIFQEKAEEASSFFSELSPYVGGRALQLSNMVRSSPANGPLSSLEVLTGDLSGMYVEIHRKEPTYEYQSCSITIGLRLHECPVHP